MIKRKRENDNFLVLSKKDIEEYQCDCWSPLEDFEIIDIKYNTKEHEHNSIVDIYDVPDGVHSITLECPECESRLKIIYDEEFIDYDSPEYYDD